MKIILFIYIFKLFNLTSVNVKNDCLNDEKQILGHFKMIMKMRKDFHKKIIDFYFANIFEHFKNYIKCLFGVEKARNILDFITFPFVRNLTKDLIIDSLMESSDFFDIIYKMKNFPDSIEPLRETTCLKIKIALDEVDEIIKIEKNKILRELIKIKDNNCIEEIDELFQKVISFKNIKYQCFYFMTSFYTEKTRFICHVMRNCSTEFTDPFNKINISRENEIEYSYVSYFLLELNKKFNFSKVFFNLQHLKKIDHDLTYMKLFLDKLLKKNKEILLIADEEPIENLKEHLSKIFKSSKSYQEAFLKYFTFSLDALNIEINLLRDSFYKCLASIYAETKNQSSKEGRKILMNFSGDCDFIQNFIHNEFIVALNILKLKFYPKIKNKIYNDYIVKFTSEKFVLIECLNDFRNVLLELEIKLSKIYDFWQYFTTERISILIINNNL